MLAFVCAMVSMNMVVETKSNAAYQKVCYFALLNNDFEGLKCLVLSLVAFAKLAVELDGPVVCMHGKCEFQASALCRPINRQSGKTEVNECAARAFNSLSIWIEERATRKAGIHTLCRNTISAVNACRGGGLTSLR